MKNRITVGIDIGTSQVKVVVAEVSAQGHRSSPKIIGTGSAESKGVRHGYIVSASDAARSLEGALAQAEKSSGIRIKSAHLAVGGVGVEEFRTTTDVVISRADAEVTSLDLSKASEQSEQQLGKKILNRKVIHAIPVGYRIDGETVLGHPEGMRGTKLSVDTLFVTVLEQHLQDLIALVEDLGISVTDVMVSPLAGSFVTLSKAQKMAGCVLANIGAETVSIVVYENNTPLSVKIFPIGATDITNDIALGLKISLEDAEALKRGTLLGTAVSQKRLDDITKARLSDMFDLIEAHLAKIGKNGLLPAGIILAGGGSSISITEDLARTILRLPARRATLTGTEGTKVRDTSWAVAYGLCIWGMTNEEESNVRAFAGRAWSNIKEVVSRFLP
jgi:cell division protein FtsA